MNIVCPNCEYHKQRAQIWRDEAYRLAGHPLPRKETSMTQDEIIEMAKQAGFVNCTLGGIECPVCRKSGYPYPKCRCVTYEEKNA